MRIARLAAAALLCGASLACSGSDEGDEVPPPEATVEVPTGEVGPAVTGDSAGPSGTDTVISDSVAAGH